MAFALADSPVGQLAWSGQLFGETVDADFHLTTPIGLANFADDFKSIRPSPSATTKNIVSWNEYSSGGHYAAHQVPDLLTDDIRAFFRDLR